MLEDHDRRRTHLRAALAPHASLAPHVSLAPHASLAPHKTHAVHKAQEVGKEASQKKPEYLLRECFLFWVQTCTCKVRPIKGSALDLQKVLGFYVARNNTNLSLGARRASTAILFLIFFSVVFLQCENVSGVLLRRAVTCRKKTTRARRKTQAQEKNVFQTHTHMPNRRSFLFAKHACDFVAAARCEATQRGSAPKCGPLGNPRRPVHANCKEVCRERDKVRGVRLVHWSVTIARGALARRF